MFSISKLSVFNIAKPLLVSYHLYRNPQNLTKTFSFIATMSWTCSKCTFINQSSQNLSCQICLSAKQQSPSSSSSPSISAPLKPKWSCAACTFLNPYRSTVCEICGTRASASLLPPLELDDDELDQILLGSSIGSVFLPLQTSSRIKKGNNDSPSFESNNWGLSDKINVADSPLQRGDNDNLGKRQSPCVNVGVNGEGPSGGKNGSLSILRPCHNKRKDREDSSVDIGGGDAGGSSGFRAVKAANKAFDIESLAAGETHLGSESKTWKILSYNVWFREDLEMHKRMKELGNLIGLHSPDVICFQEVTPSFYGIFRQSSWWKGYQCSISDEMACPGPYFCMQLCKLPVKSYSCKPFSNSIMGRGLCVAEVEVQPQMALVVATSHLESPCPGPPTWDQMFSKERVDQAKEAVRFLEKNQNVIFCGDMNWDDKSDGPFPLADEWIDAWTELRPGEVGWTYDTKLNKMLSGNRTLQKRLDRFVCKLKDFKISEIKMIGMDAIQGLSYIKEKRVKGQVKELVLPVLPSDHYGLLLTISLHD